MILRLAAGLTHTQDSHQPTATIEFHWLSWVSFSGCGLTYPTCHASNAKTWKSGPCFGFVSQAAGPTYQTGNCMTPINATERSVSECTWWYAVSVGESINLACQKQVSVKPVDLAVMSQILTSCLNKIPHGRRSTTPNP
jgi:hypothetical protein